MRLIIPYRASFILLLFQSITITFAFIVVSNHPCSSCSRSTIRSAKTNDDDDDSGYKFGDISRGLAKRFTKRVKQVTGKEDYQFGDLTKHLDQTAKKGVQQFTGKESYEFGDLSRWADASIKEKVCELTGKKEYKVGDLSSEILRRVLEGEVKWDEVLMLLKVLLSLGASFSPVAGALPAKVLIDLLNYSIAAQVGEKVTESIATELDRRMKQAVTGDPDYQLGDFTKAKLLKFVGRGDGEDYQFGDLTSTIMNKVNNNNNNNKDDKEQNYLFRDDETPDKELELKNTKILEELEDWDKAFKIGNSESPKK